MPANNREDHPELACANCHHKGLVWYNDVRAWFHMFSKESLTARCDGESWNPKEDDAHSEWARPVKDNPILRVKAVNEDEQGLHVEFEHLPKPVSPQRRLLLDAADTVDGERQEQYGNAEDSFRVIGELWTTYLQQSDKGTQIVVTDKDVALMMVLMKVAREGNSPKRDNLLDLAGYAALAQRIEES